MGAVFGSRIGSQRFGRKRERFEGDIVASHTGNASIRIERHMDRRNEFGARVGMNVDSIGSY